MARTLRDVNEELFQLCQEALELIEKSDEKASRPGKRTPVPTSYREACVGLLEETENIHGVIQDGDKTWKVK